MKKIISIGIVLSFAMCIASVNAAPSSGETNPGYYLTTENDLSPFHVGMYWRENTLDMSEHMYNYDVHHMMGFIGYDVLDWLNVYLLFGAAQMEDDMETGSDMEFNYGIGLWMNLLNHDIDDYNPFFNRFRIQTSAQYTQTEFYDITYREYTANLTFGVVNDFVFGPISAWPESLCVYFGPSVNYMDYEYLEQSRDDRLGIIVGVDLQLSARVVIGASYEVFDDDDKIGVYLHSRL